MDEAIFMVLEFVDGELGKVKGKTESQLKRGREQRLAQLFAEPGETRGRFRDPAAAFSKG